MAEQLLLVPAEQIIETLGSLAANKIALLWGLEDELQRLRNTVSTIKAVLLDAEEKQAAGNHAVTDWLKKLEDAMYDADDLLDAVSTEALHREILTRDNKAKQVRIFFSKSNQLLYRLKMAPKIKAMRERLDSIYAEGDRFHLKVRDVETRVGGNRGNTHSFVRAEAVIGRDDDKKAVIHRLLDSNVEDNVSILPIVAIGGLGKTTLAQLIFNDDQIQNHFQLQMWVCVSDPFHVQNIVENILEAATTKKPEPARMNTLVGKLKKEIDGKKYLLVLDDVWNEDLEKWSELKEVLMGGVSGSRILVTTRSEKVARISGTVQSYSLRGLKEDESWCLLKQLAFEKGKEPEETSSIAAVGREILKKCFGVPLAIRTIGSLLRFKNSEAEWSSFKENELSKIDQNEKDILPTLKLSYDHLHLHLKHCFVYCSLFPKDHWLYKSRLIQLWMAQGFVKSCDDQNRSFEEVGNEYFKDLLWRSFFQEAETDDFGDIVRCKMHDLMHDLAISVAGSLITTIDDKNRNLHEKTRHVSVVDYYNIDASSITISLCKASGIRTFLCNPTSFYTHLSQSTSVNFLDCEVIFSSSKFLRVLVLHKRNHELLPSSIGKLKHLRYLDLSSNYLKKLPNSISRLQNLQTLDLSFCLNLEELPSSIGELKHLRCLDLFGDANLKKLPNFISKLQNLQTLNLSFCFNLEELPGDMKELVNLRHLEIDGCVLLTYMPRELGLLNNLQTLSNFVVHKDPCSPHSSGLKELKGLNNLRGELVITNMRHGKDGASECKEANLKAKQHLHGLCLKWSTEGGVNASDVIVDDEMLLEVLQPHPNLKELRVKGNWGSRLPSWLLSLTNLKSLVLSRMDAMEYILDSGYSNEFSYSFIPSLKEIKLKNCPNLKGWWRRDSSVEVNSDGHNSIENTEDPLLPSFPPCLSQLLILNCPMLTSMPTFPHLEELLCLSNASWKPLQQTMMMNMGAPQSQTSTAKASSSSTPLSKLKFLQLDSLEDLETLPKEWLKKLTSLNSLTIRSCNRLNSLFPGIQHLAALQQLDLHDCPELELANVEDEMQWQGLKSLLSLKFSRLPKLVSLPLGLQHATTLQKLLISDCENLMAIPEWIHNCTSLQVLKIKGCSSLTSLPEGMRSQTSLQRLKIENCPILLQRCKREAGEDWPKIAHIPKLELQYPDSGIEVAEPAQAKKKQRIWSIFKKSRALNS
ncbi:disease resistance protein RGA2-like isoform X3 [Alnus glutinosa]|uniref:disease resistance protein RGA2-like isoform X3 n=1 Tax=Alnus glutinosa TaxID=3517 RepID=UPI002D789555|nr:disease resistance protein RGA2-like isoform X3 [Alnus glutinosa]